MVLFLHSSCVEYGTQLNCPFPSVNTTLVKNLEGGTSVSFCCTFSITIFQGLNLGGGDNPTRL